MANARIARYRPRRCAGEMIKDAEMTKIEKITPIPRGQDLTDDDLRLIVEDFYVVRNWTALRMRQGPDEIKEQCFRALQVRLGRRKQVLEAGR